MKPKEVLQELRKVQHKYKTELTPTFRPRISDMAKDSADTIEKLLNDYRWIPVSERLPKPPENDWVLVRVKFISDDTEAVPHIAEYRSDFWYSVSYDTFLEDALLLKVVAWFDPNLLSENEVKEKENV